MMKQMREAQSSMSEKILEAGLKRQGVARKEGFADSLLGLYKKSPRRHTAL
jgi:hypothetical protein